MENASQFRRFMSKQVFQSISHHVEREREPLDPGSPRRLDANTDRKRNTIKRARTFDPNGFKKIQKQVRKASVDALDISDDAEFSFVSTLGVSEELFHGRIRLHQPHGTARIRPVALHGEVLRPVLSIATKEKGNEEFTSKCLFVVPTSAPTYVGVIQTGPLQHDLETSLFWMVVSTFGLFTRKKVIVRWIPSEKVSNHTLRNNLGRTVFKEVMEGFDKFVILAKKRAPVQEVVGRMLSSRFTRYVNSDEELQDFVASRDRRDLIRSSEQDPRDTPFYTELLEDFRKRFRADVSDMYDYLMLERLWGETEAKERKVLLDLLKPNSRRHWPRTGFFDE